MYLSAIAMNGGKTPNFRTSELRETFETHAERIYLATSGHNINYS